jgi:hypothetical protein
MKTKLTAEQRARKRAKANAAYRLGTSTRTAEEYAEYKRAAAKKWRLDNPEKFKKWQRDNPERILFYHAKVRAKEHGWECTISVQDITIPAVCPVLGIPLERGVETMIDSSPTLDRLDNAKGYIAGNIAVISYKANRIKSNGTLEDLKAVVEYMEKKQK